MPSPARSVNARDPSGLRRFEDASAAETVAAMESAIGRIADSLGENPSTREIQAAVDREASAFSAEMRAMLTKQLSETYQRSSVRSAQLMERAGLRIGGTFGPVGISPELRERIELRALVNAESLAADMKARATRSLLSSVEAGEGSRDARKRLMEATGIDKVSAERIVRTEIMSAHRDVNEEQFARYGVTEERWFAALDDRTCDECRNLHEAAERGETFPVGQRPHVHGGTDINCRCITLPVIPEVGKAMRS